MSRSSASHAEKSAPSAARPFPVDLLEPDDRTVEFPFGNPGRSLDPRPPRQLVELRSIGGTQVSVRAAEAPGVRSACPYAGRVDQESARGIRLCTPPAPACECTRRPPPAGMQPIDHRLEVAHLVLGQPDGHQIKLCGRPCLTQAPESSSGLPGSRSFAAAVPGLSPLPSRSGARGRPEPMVVRCGCRSRHRHADTSAPGSRATCWPGSRFSVIAVPEQLATSRLAGMPRCDRTLGLRRRDDRVLPARIEPDRLRRRRLDDRTAVRCGRRPPGGRRIAKRHRSHLAHRARHRGDRPRGRGVCGSGGLPTSSRSRSSPGFMAGVAVDHHGPPAARPARSRLGKRVDGPPAQRDLRSPPLRQRAGRSGSDSSVLAIMVVSREDRPAHPGRPDRSGRFDLARRSPRAWSSHGVSVLGNGRDRASEGRSPFCHRGETSQAFFRSP